MMKPGPGEKSGVLKLGMFGQRLVSRYADNRFRNTE